MGFEANIETLFGSIAFITSIIGLLPQSYKAFKTKSTQDVSMLMVINFLCCSVAWMIYGLCIHSIYVVLSNVVGTVSCLALIFQKIYYDKFAITY